MAYKKDKLSSLLTRETDSKEEYNRNVGLLMTPKMRQDSSLLSIQEADSYPSWVYNILLILFLNIKIQHNCVKGGKMLKDLLSLYVSYKLRHIIYKYKTSYIEIKSNSSTRVFLAYILLISSIMKTDTSCQLCIFYHFRYLRITTWKYITYFGKKNGFGPQVAVLWDHSW